MVSPFRRTVCVSRSNDGGIRPSGSVHGRTPRPKQPVYDTNLRRRGLGRVPRFHSIIGFLSSDTSDRSLGTPQGRDFEVGRPRELWGTFDRCNTVEEGNVELVVCYQKDSIETRKTRKDVFKSYTSVSTTTGSRSSSYTFLNSHGQNLVTVMCEVCLLVELRLSPNKK